MTNSDADPRKKTDDFAKNLVHTMFGLDKLPADVGGEVLFDDYDDSPKGGSADAAAESGATAELTEAAAAEPRNSRTEYQDDIDDLIMFPEDDDQEDAAAEAEAEDDDENFDFGSDEAEDDDSDEDRVAIHRMASERLGY